MKQKNPFPFCDDNKRYHTWNYYCRTYYQNKLGKVALNANFTCPNRDGTCGYGGCVFCGTLGSGEFAGNIADPLAIQFSKGSTPVHEKWPNAKLMAYFQAYSNTYAPLTTLQDTFEPFLQMDDVQALSIATRADCLDDEIIAYLNHINQKKDIWLELGLQSIHDTTAQQMHRGHTYAIFEDCIKRLSKTNIKICVHLINSLPFESADMMIESAQALSRLPIHAVKIHMLHVMRDTQLATWYEEAPFPLLSLDEYVDIVIRQLEVLPAEIIIQRLSGDAPKDALIAPLWTRNKKVVLNSIDKEMVKRDTWQGKKYAKT